MTMSALLSALRGAGRQRLSGSTVVLPKPETVSFVFRIEGYTNVQETFVNGTAINSGMFHAGGHDWRIKCCPNGLRSEYRGFISLFLRHASHERTGDASAKFQMSVLDSAGKPWHTKIASPQYFSTNTGLIWGEREFLKIKQLKKDLKHDDCLTLLFDVTVLEVRTDDDHAQVAAAAAATPAIDAAGVSVSSCIAADAPPLSDMRKDILEKETVDVETEAETPPVKTSICEEMLCRHIDMSSVGDILAFAEQHSCCVLTEACVQFLSRPGNLKEFMATHGLETGCPSALKELILKQLP